ncbi:uncharacterized protein A4U43_C07F12930 [Asparagus officinalis]|uniref:Sec-independent protein translocase protein TatB n=1 Tax=Asparagus officinalis TaxID=4686 RepID=A0A5P1EGS1_ASPOF|nr:uncharacterized protein LOC109849906 isoform X2 [Asparagus officinalis]ONK63250.1 uncharacterized protein A4U43_C07F12930 [Asparagus officinalis]
MLGISYGELFLIVGATAALIGPKDLPVIARTAGRLVGRAIGYVQMARGQFDNVMQHSQASQVHKELQDTMAQLEAIRYEIRSISIMNPVPFTRRIDGATGDRTSANVMPNEEIKPTLYTPKSFNLEDKDSLRLHSQAMTYARLAEAPNVKSHFVENGDGGGKIDDERDGLLAVLPVSAENAGFLPKHNGKPKGSDIVLEAILEAEVAQNAKHFFSQPENQIPEDIPKR